jgi:CDP-diacylglycerol---serine O-phosphatidyltransferase
VARFRDAWPVLAPCIFTLGRLVCGLVVVTSTFEGSRSMLAPPAGVHVLSAFDRAAAAIALAIVFDVLDGQVARRLGSASSFGVQLDSLADICAFGMAPALLGFYWGVLPVHAKLSGDAARIFLAAAWFAITVFLACGVFRLARFNMDTSPRGGHAHFVGLPVPAAAAVVAAVVHFAKAPLEGAWEGVAWLVVLAVLAVLMISRIPYMIAEPYPTYLRTWRFRLPLAGLLSWGLWLHSEVTVLVGVAVCVSSGPFFDVARRLSAGRPSSL